MLVRETTWSKATERQQWDHIYVATCKMQLETVLLELMNLVYWSSCWGRLYINWIWYQFTTLVVLQMAKDFFWYKIEILLYPNLCVYVCKGPSWRLKPRSLPPTLHKHLYLWSDHHTKGVRWCERLVMVKSISIIMNPIEVNKAGIIRWLSSPLI